MTMSSFSLGFLPGKIEDSWNDSQFALYACPRRLCGLINIARTKAADTMNRFVRPQRLAIGSHEPRIFLARLEFHALDIALSTYRSFVE